MVESGRHEKGAKNATRVLAIFGHHSSYSSDQIHNELCHSFVRKCERDLLSRTLLVGKAVALYKGIVCAPEANFVVKEILVPLRRPVAAQEGLVSRRIHLDDLERFSQSGYPVGDLLCPIAEPWFAG
jgi:hypothetical protein